MDYKARYAKRSSKKAWIPYDQWLAKKQASSRRKAASSGRRSVAKSTYQSMERRPRAPRTSAGNTWSTLGSAAGGALGSTFGPAGTAVGAGLGGLAGKVLDTITGHGAYQVNANTVYQNSVPQFTSRMTDGCVRIRHKEFITDVITSGTAGQFINQQFKIDAADSETFPYLSQLAKNFEEFMFEGLVFSYVPSSGSISTTGQLGTVIMATQYNSLSQPFVNKQQAEATTYSVSQVVSQGCIHPIECDAKQTPSQGIFYTFRPSLRPQNQDPRWQQLGLFNLMTQGAPNASENIGELWVSYDVILCKPILLQDEGQQDHWSNTAAGGVAVGNYFGNLPTLSSDSSGFTTLSGGNQINIDPTFNGNISVSYGLHWTTGAAGATDANIAAGVGVTPLNILDANAGGTNLFLKVYDVTSMTLWETAYFQVVSTGVPSTIGFSLGTFGTGIDSMDLIITQLPVDTN